MRGLLTRPGLRLFHSVSRSQQLRDVPPDTKAKDLVYGNLIKDVESIPSTNRKAVATRTVTQAPQEIFDAWNATSFYAPLAFLRSRRIRPPPRRKNPPAVGPGAAEAAYEDVFRQLDVDPVHESNNDSLFLGFITSMGKMLPRAQTRLSWRSQRKVTQAIKRSRQRGVLPIAYRPRFPVYTSQKYS